MINIDPVTGDCSGVALRVLAGYRRQRANILFGQFLARARCCSTTPHDAENNGNYPPDSGFPHNNGVCTASAATTSAAPTTTTICENEQNCTSMSRCNGVYDKDEDAADSARDGGRSTPSPSPRKVYCRGGGSGGGSAGPRGREEGTDEWEGWVWEGMEVFADTG